MDWYRPYVWGTKTVTSEIEYWSIKNQAKQRRVSMILKEYYVSVTMKNTEKNHFEL